MWVGKIETVFPLQSFGLGDIIFSQALINKISNGIPITWGVEEQFIEGLNEAYPHVNFVDKSTIPEYIYNIKEEIIIDGMLILPIRFANEIIKTPYRNVMRAKYDMYGQDYKIWDTINFKRNVKKENELFYDVLGLKDNDVFILKNTKYRSNLSGDIKISIKDRKTNIVEVRQIDRFSLFNWAKVIEKASQIHTVSTSINYIIQLLKYKGKVYIYKRHPEENNHNNYDYIFSGSNIYYM